jgi:hypothetical protein
MCCITRLRNASLAMQFEMLCRSSSRRLGNVSPFKAGERIASDALQDAVTMWFGASFERVALLNLEAHRQLRVPRDTSGLLSARSKRVAQPTKVSISYRLIWNVDNILLRREELLCMFSDNIRPRCHNPKLKMIELHCHLSSCING